MNTLIVLDENLNLLTTLPRLETDEYLVRISHLDYNFSLRMILGCRHPFIKGKQKIIQISFKMPLTAVFSLHQRQKKKY